MLGKQERTFCCTICSQRPQIFSSSKIYDPKNEASCEIFVPLKFPDIQYNIYIHIYTYIYYCDKNIVMIKGHLSPHSIPLCEKSKEKLGMYGSYHLGTNYQVLIESIWC